MRSRLLFALASLTVPALLLHACSSEEVNATGSGASAAAGSGASSSTESASGGTSSGGSGSGTGGAGASASGAAGPGSGGSGACGTTQCTDCIDNDMDGFTDAFDLECVGPLDNDESSFATGIPGDNMDPCKQDCFFDGNSGSGDDKCEWNLKCDPANPGAPDCPYDANFNNCPETQQDQCIEFCLSKTPNGCDCFGCCEVTLANMTTVTVLIGSSGCTEETLTDPTLCKPCTQVADCTNDCEPCEYCLGKVILPPECTPDGGTGSGGGGGGGGAPGECPPGSPPCDMQNPCPADLPYCLTGCCIEIPS